MTATAFAANLSRAHYGGANADQDIHIEAYEGDIEGSFKVESLFRTGGLTNFKPISGTNTWRGDRIGGATVKGRTSGVQLDATRIVNEKMLITVDTTSYIRTAMDYQDDWTSPDFQSEYSEEHGTAHAKAFDQAHIIQLIKAGAWVAPTTLTNFSNGISATMTGYAALVASGTDADLESAAAMIVRQHKNAVATFIKRDMGSGASGFVTLMDPDTFNILLEHKKLMNVEFQGTTQNAPNSFADRRIGTLNGLKVIETPRFPTAAIASHFLGPAFNVSATEAKAKMIIFNPKKTLVTVEAQGMVVRVWDDKAEFCNVLDSYTMYTVGIKRGDGVAVVFSD